MKGMQNIYIRICTCIYLQYKKHSSQLLMKNSEQNRKDDKIITFSSSVRSIVGWDAIPSGMHMICTYCISEYVREQEKKTIAYSIGQRTAFGDYVQSTMNVLFHEKSMYVHIIISLYLYAILFGLSKAHALRIFVQTVSEVKMIYIKTSRFPQFQLNIFNK